MSIETTYHPKSATREQLKDHMLSCGFLPARFEGWKLSKGELSFLWFDTNDYRSFSGVIATIFPLSSDDKYFVRGKCEWGMYTRTTIAATPYDLEQQNHVIRSARKKFGGSFFNDWYGVNRYNPIPEDIQGPVGRGLFQAYEFVEHKLAMVKIAVPKPMYTLSQTNEQAAALQDPKNKHIRNSFDENDPSHILYHALIPFAVAALEYFFGQTFKILLKYDEKAQRKLLEQNRKVEMGDVIEISKGHKTLEEVIANWYSFQNLQSINAAFKDWFDIDIWKLLRKKKKIGKRIVLLDKHFDNIIQFRHGVIHRFEFDFQMGYEQIVEVLDSTVLLIDIFVDYLEKERGLTIHKYRIPKTRK